MGSSAPSWRQVDGPPPAITFGLVPLEDHDGASRRVMLLAWMLDERGIALVQPIIKGQDQALPWGMHTRAADPPAGGRPEDGIAGYAGTFDRGADGYRAQVSRRQGGEIAQQTADGRACGGDDDDGIGSHAGSFQAGREAAGAATAVDAAAAADARCTLKRRAGS